MNGRGAAQNERTGEWGGRGGMGGWGGMNGTGIGYPGRQQLAGTRPESPGSTGDKAVVKAGAGGV